MNACLMDGNSVKSKLRFRGKVSTKAPLLARAKQAELMFS